jgi:hypothetical protein
VLLLETREWSCRSCRRSFWERFPDVFPHRRATPRVLGLDEHFFAHRLGYATTFCDLRGHKVFDVVLGRSFTCNNGITEGFHTKMELLSRQAYGFRNFQNYRLRVKVMCS